MLGRIYNMICCIPPEGLIPSVYQGIEKYTLEKLHSTSVGHECQWEVCALKWTP